MSSACPLHAEGRALRSLCFPEEGRRRPESLPGSRPCGGRRSPAAPGVHASRGHVWMREALLTTRPPFPFTGGATASPRGAAARGLDKAPTGVSGTPWPAPGCSVACQAFLPAGGLAAKIRETDGRPEAKIRDLSLQGPVRRQYILTAVMRPDGERNHKIS